MDKPALHIGQRVELAPGMETVYPSAMAGMRGVIRGFVDDEFGFDRCYIEWDKDHWRYDGEKDLWTYTSHFQPAQMDGDHDLISAEEHEVPNSVPGDSLPDLSEEYINRIMDACDKAAESDGFYFVTLKRDEENRISLEIISASSDEYLLSLSGADIFRFVEQEMRQRGL